MDHERVNISSSSTSCGVMELSRIGKDFEDVAYAIASRLYHPARGNPCAFFIWSDIVTDKSNDFADFVTRDHNFGTVRYSDTAENPKTGNIIAVYTWCINHEKFKKWYAEQRLLRIQNVGAQGYDTHG